MEVVIVAQLEHVESVRRWLEARLHDVDGGTTENVRWIANKNPLIFRKDDFEGFRGALREMLES